MLRSWLIRALVALLVLPILLYGVGPLRLREGWHSQAQPYKFSVIGWEVKNVWDKWSFLAQELWPGEPPDEAKKERVEAYFTLAAKIGEVEARLLQTRAASGLGLETAAIEAELKELRRRQNRWKAEVEETLEAQLSRAIQEEGITLTLSLGFRWDYFFPPLDMKFERLPHLLIISPREKIETKDTVLLEPQMSLSQIEDLEAQVATLGVSSYIEAIGGLATYPTHIPETSSLEWTLQVAAHEWLHTYLFFKPLGRSYTKDQELRTVNETLADMAGRELASRVLVEFYGRPPIPTPKPPGPPPEPPPPEVFDFNREMRRIRLEVGRLLALGEVEAAESFMEESRRFLASQGHPLRKLNQAYFAFHGSYADSPTSVSPIGGQLAELRRRSLSLGDFVKAVASLSSYQSLLAILETAP